MQDGELGRGDVAELEERVDVGAGHLELDDVLGVVRIGRARVLVRLRDDAQRVGADAQVRVHRDEHGRPRLVAVAHVDRDLEDRAVLRAGVEADHQRLGPLLGDGDAQRAAAVERDAARERLPVRLAEVVEEPRDVARVAPALGALALELVDLLDRVDRDDEIVVLELEDRLRVVQEHVRIEDVVLLHGAAT